MLKIDYQLRRSARAKLARIIVSPDKIEVVAPVRMPQQQITQFVHAKQAWIQSALAKVRLKAQQVAPLAPERYGQGVFIPYQGRHYVLLIKPSALKRIKVEFDSAFQVSIPTALDQAAHDAAIKAALSAWMKKTALLMVSEMVQQHAQRFQLVPHGIRIKTQRSRWGSCSSTNAININWLLMLAPPVILEYVVVHELCHIREKNHSAAFWQLVAEHLPDYQQRRHWLKQHGASLMRGL
jgi:predicted metal-dependent hydrolase